MLSTSDFAKAIGVSESSVRRLADSGDLGIHRTRGGHRRIPMAEAVRYVRENRTELARPDLLGLEIDSPPASSDGAAERLLRVLREGHASAVIRLMQSWYASGMTVADLCDGPIRHAMTEIGEAWPSDKRAIFVEHRAVILCIRALHQLRLSITDPDPDAPDAIGGAPSGDSYLLPTLAASLVLHDAGFNETNLGPNIPLDVLADCILDESPALVWLSLSEPLRSRLQLRELQKLAEVARAQSVTLVLGGRYLDDVEASKSSGDAWISCRTMEQLKQVATRVLLEREATPEPDPR